MLAMVCRPPGRLLCKEVRPAPQPGPGEVRLKVRACGVCRTDLHVVDGDLPPVRPSIVPGHEIIGVVDAVGPGVSGVSPGDRLGVPWLGETCGRCRYCLADEENLCDAPGFTGWTRDGGYAEAVVARADFCFPIPDELADPEAAPLMCAGLIGYRCWKKTAEHRPVERLGLYGFGAAAHLLAQLAIWTGQQVYAFTREGDAAAQGLARDLGCAWAGGSDQPPPEPLDAAIIFAPVGALVPAALRAVRKGGTVVCGGIHMSEIPALPYSILWEERRLVSVANLTRQDGREYLPLAARAGVRPHVKTYGLEDANAALQDLRDGAFAGAAVLLPPES
ncbi:zinc-dependent alcohol dehydrogenase family protein [Phenylobacterium soli]|uniref:alcohol dehydrogenase n=1 Tax=Phenylobacterium soli TaxID=2170551 RepID=A0A328AHM5_9CAUL|nr:zinc-dependent alcohol dehydrogenase family protein [Phenylobacterium soli]RAK54015.1 alcohol dehydrogenase [Phenylobacterium soli]